jgi:hypothetical protein
MPLTRHDVDDVKHSSLRDAHRYLESRRDSSSASKNLGKSFLTALETAAGAGAVGWLAGRMGTTSIGTSGVPLGLVAGAAGHALTVFGLLDSKWDAHIQNVSNGAISGWTALWAAGQGSQSRAKAGGVAGPITAGSPPPGPPPPQQFPAYQPPMRQMNPPPVSSYNVYGTQAPAPYQRRPGPLTEAELQGMSRER